MKCMWKREKHALKRCRFCIQCHQVKRRGGLPREGASGISATALLLVGVSPLRREMAHQNVQPDGTFLTEVSLPVFSLWLH